MYFSLSLPSFLSVSFFHVHSVFCEEGSRDNKIYVKKKGRNGGKEAKEVERKSENKEDMGKKEWAVGRKGRVKKGMKSDNT